LPHQGDFTTLNHSLATPAWAEAAERKRARPKEARSTPVGASFLTIMAHSDDDLLFVNPDLQPAIASGLPVRAVVLTADEYNGNPPMSREQLAAQLREGTRRAYASLAGVTSNWRRETTVVAQRTVEVDTLVPAPRIQLCWLSLPDGGDDLHRDALLNLWQDSGYVTNTIVPTGGPVTQVQQYDGERLYLVLVGLLDLFQPTIIRVQDPAPDWRHRPDHGDHVVATAFAQLAVRTYEGPTATGLALLTRYRCYNTSESAENVPNALLGQKTAAYRQYNALDPLTGDGFDANLARNYHRFPVSAPWAVRDGTGTLHAIVVGADDVIAWRQAAGATTWTGPTSLGSGQFAPGVAMACNANGRVQLAILDLDTAEVLTTTQSAAGGGFGAWTSIGRPDGNSPLYGVPALGVNSDGGLEMYLLDESGGLSNAYQPSPGNVFDGWYGVGGGPDVMGQPLVHTEPNGLLHVFADSNGEIAHWTQPPGGGTSPAGFPTIECVATPSAATEGSGSARVLTREYGDGAVGTSVDNGGWSGLTHIGGQGGVGPVAAVRSGGATPRVLVFARNDGYGISVSRQAAGGAFGAWQDLGGYCEVGPAAVVDSAGLVRLLAVGADCKLYERKQTATGPDGAFDAWHVAGT
jgi:LmbE family N-acetylglucosaminyl deacetylase